MRRLLIGSAVALAVMPALAQTCDPGDALAFQCDFRSGKRLMICSSATSASYRFGRPGTPPELVLRTPLATLDYATSGGSSMDTTDIVFKNGRTAYRLEYTTFFERQGGGGGISHEGGESGTLVVLAGDRTVARLECGKGTIRENFQSIRRAPCRDSCAPSP